MPTIEEMRKKALELVARGTGQMTAGDGASLQTKRALVESGVFDPKVDFAPPAPVAPVAPALPDPTEAELDRKRALQEQVLKQQRAEDAERRRRALSERRLGAGSFGTPTGPEEKPFGGVPR